MSAMTAKMWIELFCGVGAADEEEVDDDIIQNTYDYDKLIKFYKNEKEIDDMLDHFNIDDVNEYDEKRNTLLHAACKKLNILLVECLLRNGRINVNTKDSKGQTALHMAISNSKYYVNKPDSFYRSHGDNTNETMKKRFKYGKCDQYQKNIHIIELLLKNAAIDINKINKENICAIELALDLQKADIIKLIIANCAPKIIPINSKQFYKIMYCKPLAAEEILSALLPYIENINMKLHQNNDEKAMGKKNVTIFFKLLLYNFFSAIDRDREGGYRKIPVFSSNFPII